MKTRNYDINIVGTKPNEVTVIAYGLKMRADEYIEYDPSNMHSIVFNADDPTYKEMISFLVDSEEWETWGDGVEGIDLWESDSYLVSLTNFEHYDKLVAWLDSLPEYEIETEADYDTETTQG